MLDLSIIMPYHKRIEEFRQTLVSNYDYYRNRPYEIIICADEDSEAGLILETMQEYSDLRWRLIVNSKPHPWRPPCCAINVGIQHALAPYCLVLSPESAFMTDVPQKLIAVATGSEFAIGAVEFGTFDQEIPAYSEMDRMLYGSICFATAMAKKVRGYDESFDWWGGDDDNFRLRLEMAGFQKIKVPDAVVFHREFKDKITCKTRRKGLTDEQRERIFHPKSYEANAGEFGMDFNTVLFDWNK